MARTDSAVVAESRRRPRNSVPTFEDLAALHVAAEKLLMLPKADLWLVRRVEYLTDDAKIRGAVVKLLSAVNRSIGRAGFVDLVRQVEATADNHGKPSLAAGEMTFIALMQRISDAVLEEHVPRIMEAVGHAALRSMNAERELLGVEPLDTLQKAVFNYTDVAQVFRQRFSQLATSVEGFMVNAVGNHAHAVTSTLVNAANPASPLAIGPLQRQLRGEISDLTVRRATMIARTETARVYNETARATQRELGILRGRIATAGDPCPICVDEAARGIVPLDDLAEVPLHPNCRCDTIPDVENWLPPLPGEETA